MLQKFMICLSASLLLTFFALLSLAAALDGGWVVAGVLVTIALILAGRMLHEAASAAAVFSGTIRHLERETGNG